MAALRWQPVFAAPQEEGGTVDGGDGNDEITGGHNDDAMNGGGGHEDGDLTEEGHQPLTFDQIAITDEAITITLITGEASLLTLDQDATMQIDQNISSPYSDANIVVI